MPDPSGAYDLNPVPQGDKPSTLVLHYDGQGHLIDSSIDGTPIYGLYDVDSGHITFNDAARPGDIFNVFFYDGYSLVDQANEVGALAGIVQEQRFRWVGNHLESEHVHFGWFATARLAK
jgi:hypothetical protein